MLKIRLRRMGAIRQPHYRIVVADARAPRDGAFIDMLGHYNPLTDPATIQVDVTKYEDWKKKGAQPTNAVASLVKLYKRAQAKSESATTATAAPSTQTRTASGKRSARATAAPVAEAAVEEAAPVEEAVADIVPGKVVIADVSYKGDEYVEIRNDDDLPIDLAGWILRDKNDADQSFTFPEGSELKAGGTFQVFTAPGHTQSFDSKRPIWNDAGDVAELLSADGKVISTFAYGSYAEDASKSETAEDVATTEETPS
jgi:small subunit ribosomal protein S16